MANHSQQNESQVAVVMVPLPAQGHLNQLLHLSHTISSTNIPVYYVGAAVHLRQAKLRLHGWNPSSTPNLNFHEFPTPPFKNPPPNPNSSIKFPSQLVPSISSSLNLRDPFFQFVKQISEKYTRVVVIFDSLMSYVVQDIVSIPNAESYCFKSISAFSVHSFQYIINPNTETKPEILKKIPGPDELFPPEFLEFSRLQRGTRQFFVGDIYNSSRAIEGSYLDKMNKTGAEKIWAIGPFNSVENNDSMTDIHPNCLKFLDKQRQDSVIFVSFGTTSSLSDKQIQELALGLEKSEQKFIWVLRDADKGDIFNGETRKAELPLGFEERVKERGIIIRDWAPQLQILSHVSVGGFMSHCGWNSCMESMSMGVPIAAWPMHSDQPTNAVLVTKVLKVGVEVMDLEWRNEVVCAERVESVVRKLMESEEGEEIRKRAKELGVAVRESVKEGGSSKRDFESFIKHITRL